MRVRSAVAAIVFLATSLLVSAGPANADVPVGPAVYVPCPGRTGVESAYRGTRAPYRCHSAVRDPAGTVVVLRQGRSNSRSASFGWLHAQFDHNVEDHVIERVVSSAFPLGTSEGRVRYIAELRVHGHGVMSVWVEADLETTRDAPDDQAFGVLTAYCKVPSRLHAENRCPDWVNDSLL